MTLRHPVCDLTVELNFEDLCQVGNMEALLEGVLVTCWIEEESVMWPGVSEAALDAGGYPGQFAPLRNVSNVSNAAGIAVFEMRFTRADPTFRIRLVYTAFPVEGRGPRMRGAWVGGEASTVAMATAQSQYFRVIHHFANFSLVRALTFDEEVNLFCIYVCMRGKTVNCEQHSDPCFNRYMRTRAHNTHRAAFHCKRHCAACNKEIHFFSVFFSSCFPQ